MCQILQFVLNNGGSKGSEGPKWVKFPQFVLNRGVKGVGAAKMGQFVLHNGGSKGSEGPNLVKFSNSC